MNTICVDRDTDVASINRLPLLPPVGATSSFRARAADGGADDGYRRVRIVDEAVQLRDAVRDLRRLLERTPRLGTASAVSVRSASPVALGDTAVNAVKRSTEAINPGTTTFDPASPAWSGTSTAEPTIGGEHTGAPDTPTFTVTSVSSNGKQPHKLKVVDGSGNQLEQVSVNPATQDTTTYTLSNGLTVAFGAGDFVVDDSFSVDVFAPRPAVVDPDAPLDGTGANSPNLPAGTTVTDGSFTVNGTLIEVLASDSINQVLARITERTDVAATFDAASQRVVLTREVAGDLPIDLGGDTSRFSPSCNSTMPRSKSTDSLEDVLARVRASSAGVDARLWADGRVQVRSLTKGETLTLVDHGTGFLAAIGIDQGSFESSGSRGTRLAAVTADRIARATTDIGEVMTRILATEAEGRTLRSAIGSLGRDARRVFADAFDVRGEPARHRTAGLTLTLDSESPSVFATSTADRRRLSTELSRDFEPFRSAMLTAEPGSDDSLLDRVEELATRLLTTARTNVDLRL